MKTKKQMALRDILISKGNEIAPNLVCDPQTSEGKFVINFLINSPSEILKEIFELANRNKHYDLELWFYQKTEAKKTAKRLPENSVYGNFANCKVTVGNVSVYLSHTDAPMTHYINITFNKM